MSAVAQVCSVYVPAENPAYRNDPISAHADQQLAEWAWDNGHRALTGVAGIRCECGRPFSGPTTDTDLRAHWAAERIIDQHTGADHGRT